MSNDNIAQINPLLQKIKLPGRIFQLPSKGVFYTDGELGENVVNGEIHIHAMSAIDEINMKNPDMLFSGKAIEEVCKSCIPDIKKPNRLLARDVDAIMIFLRVVTYGPYFEIEVQHDCKDAKKHDYSVNIENIINSMIYLDPTIMDQSYTLTLPNEQVVKFQPARYEHVIKLLQANETKKEFTAEDIKNTIMNNMLDLILSVDDITDRQLIGQWLMQIPATYANRIAERLDKLNDWGPSTKYDLICKDCSKTNSIDIPLNPINFFSE